MILSHALLGLAWAAYGIIHSLLASRAIKTRLQELMGGHFRYYRFLYSLLALLLLSLIVIWQLQIPTKTIWPTTRLTAIAAAILMFSGLAGMVYSLRKYLALPLGFAAIFLDGRKPSLQKTGLHAIVRHPLYLSTFIFLIGLLLAFPLLSLAISVTVIIGYTMLAIPLEEEKLLEVYGEEYVRYKAEVPAILPKWRISGLTD